MEKEYALALANSLARGTDEVALVDGFMKHLKEEGRMKILPGVLSELKALQAYRSASAPSLEVASEAEKAGAISAASALGLTPGAVTVNPSLIKGWRARSGSTLVDRSAKQALVDLYQKITN
ncbi:MAG TPA: F0F1 ATP synthase subunit delta [Candidatus Paceibacterota bacterium]|jgi:F0F1-type ATP synthase delta subunit|nr:F0F1 ATP synthase subunit delta [Candidatus Paceibacterota bacterium]